MDPNAFQKIVGEWGEKTFPNATLDTILQHLIEEVNELGDACRADNPDDVMEEAADVYLLLLHITHRIGASLDAAAKVKFAMVKDQIFEDDGRGYAKRVKGSRL